MSLPFLYDTHYQLDKPFALIHLTLKTTSPTEHITDDALSRRLSSQATAFRVRTDGDFGKWNINKDAMKYWIGNCQQSGLLTRQNSYGYWLINFHWADVFADNHTYWGDINCEKLALGRLLLFRWAWLCDAPMLTAVGWKLALGTWNTRKLVEKGARNVEELLESVLLVLRENSADTRDSVKYRLLVERFKQKPLELNTRRHKLLTHLGLLSDSGLVVRKDEERVPVEAFAQVMREFSTSRDAIKASLKEGPLGQGGDVFLQVAKKVFGIRSTKIVDLDNAGWEACLSEVRSYYEIMEKWDRKFLNIHTLAEFFLVKNFLANREIWDPASWPDFLLARARLYPDELTVHVNRFGKVEFLRLSAS